MNVVNGHLLGGGASGYEGTLTTLMKLEYTSSSAQRTVA